MVMVFELGPASEVSADGRQAVGLRHVAAPPSHTPARRILSSCRWEKER